jgi:hypothetical protein
MVPMAWAGVFMTRSCPCVFLADCNPNAGLRVTVIYPGMAITRAADKPFCGLALSHREIVRIEKD